MIETKYIVAGNHREFTTWIGRNSKPDVRYIYVKDVLTLVGLQGISGFYIGSYKDRLDIEDLQTHIAIRRVK